MFDDTQQPQPTPEQPVQPEAPSATSEAPAAPPQPTPPAVPTTPAVHPVKTTQEERMWSAIGYIAFLGVVTLAMMPKSDFCKKHAQQGILLFIFWFIGLIVLALPITILSGIGGLVLLAITIVAILGIVKSISSYELNLPVISGLAKMIPAETIVGSLTGKKPVPTAPAAPTQATPEEAKAPSSTPAAPDNPVAPATPETPAAPEAPAAEETPKEPQA